MLVYQFRCDRFDSRGDVAKESTFFHAGQPGVDSEGLIRQICREIGIFRGSAMIIRIEASSRHRVEACKCSPSSLPRIAIEN